MKPASMCAVPWTLWQRPTVWILVALSTDQHTMAMGLA